MCHISLCTRLEGDHYERERCDPTQVQPSSGLQSDFSEQKNPVNFSSRSAPPPICPLFPFLSLRRTPAPPSSDHLLNGCPWTWAVCIVQDDFSTTFFIRTWIRNCLCFFWRSPLHWISPLCNPHIFQFHDMIHILKFGTCRSRALLGWSRWLRRGSCPPTLYLTIRPNAAKITNTFTNTNTIFNTNTQTKKLDPMQLASDHEALSAPCLVSIVGAWDMLPVCGNWKGQQETTVWTTTTSAQTLRAPLLVPSIVSDWSQREEHGFFYLSLL